MRLRSGRRAVAVGLTSAGLLTGSLWGASTAFGAGRIVPGIAVVFRVEHVHGAKAPVLVAGRGLVVYTFTGDKRGKPGTCTGHCAAVWPAVRGVPVLARGAKIRGKFGIVHGQITFDGSPLYLYTGERPGQDHAARSFKVVAG